MSEKYEFYDDDTQTLICRTTEEVVNTETGEVEKIAKVSKVVYGDNFWKCYLMTSSPTSSGGFQ